jgi:hypothetical protein
MTASKRVLIQELLGMFTDVINTLNDARGQGKNFKYQLVDALKCAFAVFCVLFPTPITAEFPAGNGAEIQTQQFGNLI